MLNFRSSPLVQIVTNLSAQIILTCALRGDLCGKLFTVQVVQCILCESPAYIGLKLQSLAADSRGQSIRKEVISKAPATHTFLKARIGKQIFCVSDEDFLLDRQLLGIGNGALIQSAGQRISARLGYIQTCIIPGNTNLNGVTVFGQNLDGFRQAQGFLPVCANILVVVNRHKTGLNLSLNFSNGSRFRFQHNF